VGNRITGTIAWLIAASAAWLSCQSLAGSLAGRTPVDRDLPLLGAAIVLIAWLARRTAAAAPIVLGVPLLMVVEMAIADERSRLFLLGVVVAGALAAAIAALADREGIATAPARLLAMLAVMLLRTAGWHPQFRDLIQAGIILIGVAALIQLFSSPVRRLPTACLALGVVIGIVTPSFPFAASLYPLVLALLGLVMRTIVREASGEVPDRPLLFAAASGAIIVSVVGGRWLLWIVAATLVAAIISRSRPRAVALVPAVAAAGLIPSRLYTSLASLRAWTIAPFFVTGGGTSAPIVLVSATLAVLAIVSRPTLAPLVALAVAVLGAVIPRSARLEGSAPVFAILIVALLAWSGVPARFFPLPLGVAALALIAAAAVSGRFAVVVAAVGVSLVWIEPVFPNAGDRIEAVGIALAPGASFRFEGHAPAAVIVSGANIAHLRSGTLLGQMVVVDRRGRETKRDITVGDASDWGFLRQRLYFYSRNPLPRDPRGQLIGYGYDAFVTGGGRVTIGLTMSGATSRITAATSLPKTARLQIDALERAP
jgi:hypothetical protein